MLPFVSDALTHPFHTRKDCSRRLTCWRCSSALQGPVAGCWCCPNTGWWGRRRCTPCWAGRLHRAWSGKIFRGCLRRWRDHMVSVLCACLEHGTAFDEEVQLLSADGRHLWVRALGETVRGPAGEVSHLSGVIQDLTAHKRAEQEAQSLTMRLATTLASIHDAFVTVDREGRLSYLNPESERLLGRPGAALLGLPIWDALDGDGVAQLRHNLAAASAMPAGPGVRGLVHHRRQVAGAARLSLRRRAGPAPARRDRAARGAAAPDAAGRQHRAAERHRHHHRGRAVPRRPGRASCSSTRPSSAAPATARRR